MAACRGDDDKQHLEEQDGRAPQYGPSAIGKRAARSSGASIPARASAGVFARHSPDGEPLARKDRLGRVLDPRAVRQHVLAPQCAGVVKIDVY